MLPMYALWILTFVGKFLISPTTVPRILTFFLKSANIGILGFRLLKPRVIVTLMILLVGRTSGHCMATSLRISQPRSPSKMCLLASVSLSALLQPSTKRKLRGLRKSFPSWLILTGRISTWFRTPLKSLHNPNLNLRINLSCSCLHVPWGFKLLNFFRSLLPSITFLASGLMSLMKTLFGVFHMVRVTPRLLLIGLLVARGLGMFLLITLVLMTGGFLGLSLWSVSFFTAVVIPLLRWVVNIRMLFCGTTTPLRLFTCLPVHELLPVCILLFNSPFWLWKLSLRWTSCPPSTVRLVLLFVISVSMVLLLVCLVAHGSPILRKLLKRSLSTFPTLEVVVLFIPQWSWSEIRFLTCMDRYLSVPSVRGTSCITRLSSVVGSAAKNVHPSMLDNLVHETRLQLPLALRLLYSFFLFRCTPFLHFVPPTGRGEVLRSTRAVLRQNMVWFSIEGDGHPTIGTDLDSHIAIYSHYKDSYCGMDGHKP